MPDTIDTITRILCKDIRYPIRSHRLAGQDMKAIVELGIFGMLGMLLLVSSLAPITASAWSVLVAAIHNPDTIVFLQTAKHVFLLLSCLLVTVCFYVTMFEYVVVKLSPGWQGFVGFITFLSLPVVGLILAWCISYAETATEVGLILTAYLLAMLGLCATAVALARYVVYQGSTAVRGKEQHRG